MKPVFRFLFTLWCVLALGTAAWAATDPQPYWNDARAAIRHGAYHDALQSLETILSLTPDDPWAQLYRTLVTLRLQSAKTLPQFSPEQLKALKTQLEQEERDRKHFAAEQKRVERKLQQEQAKWDQELALLQRQAEQEDRVRRQQAQHEAVESARAQHAQRRTLAREEALHQPAAAPPAATPEGVKPTAAPGAPEQPAPAAGGTPPAGPAPATGGAGGETQPLVSGTGTQAVELSPVVVPTAPGAAPATEPVSPSLVGRAAPPKGAVQINADQMSVSPDQRVAYADGNVEVVFENALLTCDHLTLFTDTKDVYAEGRVRLEQGQQVFRGEMVHYNFQTKKGRFLQGTVSSPPWHEHGRSVEHIAEGVYQVTPGYLTSCELEPPHFKFYGSRATVFADDKFARAHNATFFVEQVPFLYLPFVSFSNQQSPFFIIPGKRKPWGPFALMGYRYELPDALGDMRQSGTLHLDWRRFFVWGLGLDHQVESKRLGRGLLKLYYNEEQDLNVQNPKATLPKGAAQKRYRLLWRHKWEPFPDTQVITDYQKFSDVNFRKDFLFREEFSNDDTPESFISIVKNDPNFTLTGLARKRVNRFQTVNEALPQITLDVRQQQISDTMLFSQSHLDFANFQTRRAHSDNDTDVIRADWFQKLSYALNLFRPILVTPNAGVRETFYTKDIQSGDTDRPQGQRDFFSGQFSAGADASLKLFRVFPVTTNALGLNINGLRHVLTPTLSHSYIHAPTVPNELLNFAAASGPTNQLTLGLENKLQTHRPVGPSGKLRSLDVARFIVSVPYAFRSSGNKQGGRLNNWGYDLELYPWPWMRLEADWQYRPVNPATLDSHVPNLNFDMVIVGGQGTPLAQTASEIQAPARRTFQIGPLGGLQMIPRGQWYLGFGHRYSQNDKTEDVLQYDWRFSDKWQLGTFQRYTWKEVVGSSKRFNNLREYQYSLRRDLHDWMAEFVYRVDREYGEELFLTLTLKAYPQMPLAFSNSYHQPKIGSQSSPFSPLRSQSPQ